MRPVMAARITYLGELGWELHIPTEFVAHVYETLRAAGAAFGITDAGYKAINSLRMEKRYLYWSADISPDDTPFEAGLGFAVSLKKGDFLGRDALLAQKEAGLKRRLECFALETPLPVYGGEAMIANGKVIGMTTSGDFGHSVGRSLVLGYVPAEYFGQNTHGNRGLWPAQPGDAYRRLRLRPEKRAGEGMSRKPPAGAGWKKTG